MDFNSGRLEAPSRITEYSPKYSEEERGRRGARRGKATPPPDEEPPAPPEEDEIHQLDDVV